MSQQIPLDRIGQGPSPDKVASRHHYVEVEELIAHLQGQHACSLIADYVQAVQATAIEAKAKVGVATPTLNGDLRVQVEVDSGAILSEPHHRRYMDKLHREHSHDYGDAFAVASLHRWKDDDDG